MLIQLLKRVFAPALACLLIALCLPAAKRGISDINTYPVRYDIQRWQNENRTPTPTELADAQTAIQLAIDWNQSPELYDYQGRLFHYEALIAENSSQATNALQNALQSYQHSSSLRKQWPYSQANVALMKALLGEFDQEYLNMLRQSATNGPWENGVNLALTEAGLLGWVNLNKQDKHLIVENIQRGIRRNMRHMKVIISQYNKLSLVCANIQRDRYQKQLCGA